MNLHINPDTLRENYIIDKTKKTPIIFFLKGTPYKLWGLFESKIHLFGTKDGKVLFSELMQWAEICSLGSYMEVGFPCQ